MRSAFPWRRMPSNSASPRRSAASGRRPASRLARLLLFDPADRFHQARLPQGAEHGMDGRAVQQSAAPGQQLRGIAIVVAQPFFQNLVDGSALPGGAVVGIDRIEAAQSQDRLGIECEGIGLQPVDRRYGNLRRPLVALRPGLGTVGGLRTPRIVERQGKPFKPRVVRKPAGHGLQPQPQARGDCRRAAVAPRAGDEHLRRSERTRKVVGGKADTKLEARQPEVRPDFRRQPRIGCRKRRPDTLVQPAEDHQIRLLQARLEQAPDEDARVPAVGRPDCGHRGAIAGGSARRRRPSQRGPLGPRP